MVVNNRLGYLFVFLGMSMALYAQRKTEVIRYGDLDQWGSFHPQTLRCIPFLPYLSILSGRRRRHFTALALRIRLSEIDLLSRKFRLGAVLT